MVLQSKSNLLVDNERFQLPGYYTLFLSNFMNLSQVDINFNQGISNGISL